MKVGVAGPVAIDPLVGFFRGQVLPNVYSFPLLSNYVLKLIELGHAVTVFCGSDEIESTQWIQGDGILLCITPRRHKRMALDFYRTERRFIAEAMRESDCDLIHAHWTYEFAAAAMQSQKPTLITAHDAPLNILPYYLGDRGSLHWIMRIMLGIKVMHCANYLTAVSPYVAQHIERFFRPRKKIMVVPNGVDPSIARCARKEDMAPPVICSVMTGWGKLKNAQPALKAFALVRQQFPTAKYRIFGTGYEVGGAACTWATTQGLSEGVEFCGKVLFAALMEEIAGSSVFLHPALEESFGMSIAEAMALGVPVVAGERCGAVPYVLNDGQAGLLVDVQSPDAIARALLQLLNDGAKRGELSKAGREFVLSNFTLDKMAEGYLEAYQKILDDQW
ncbi:N-acetyl-alpha-D-glucosaminyl L-malate synthase [Pontiella desulfatans]|uniref:N-acetyl-alpha-D-glucosaminyl L-malate synthase n=2 Tax=Pontiella desulfatans TaxID=2750659 RepID=A0A6C2TXT8_PONDE|nr:N-acetyl-alpha-D-glucosaminyl L-malate synthase [Pontiella desulfatans]